MEGQPTTPARRHSFRSDLCLLALLMALAAGIGAWLFWHTEVAARDSIGYIRMGWMFQHHPWTEVLRKGGYHPTYPILLLATSQVVRQVVSMPEPVTMQISAQLTSILASVLLVIPMFYLGRELFPRRVAFWACVLFLCLPASGRALSDGVSEATFLLFAVSGLYLAVRALRGNSPPCFALCGVCGALAYLTRPEGALIVGATGVVLLGMQAVHSWRRSWRQTILCGAALSLAAAVVSGPLPVVTGRLTVKNSGKMWLDAAEKEFSAGEPARLPAQEGTTSGPAPSVSVASLHPFLPLGLWWVDEKIRHSKVLWGFRAVGFEIMKGFHWVAWVPALLGLWWFRDRLRTMPGSWVLFFLCLSIALLLLSVAILLGYVSSRHTVLLILCGSYSAVAAVVFASHWCSAVVLPRFSLHVGAGLCTALVVLALAGSALPKTLEPLHANRSGFRAAGFWLGEHLKPGDKVIDPYCWTSYYSGYLFQEVNLSPAGGTCETMTYVVVEDSNNPHNHLPLVEKVKQLIDKGEEVYRWEEAKAKGRIILIYAVPVSR
jgi:hypothetical protein